MCNSTSCIYAVSFCCLHVIMNWVLAEICWLKHLFWKATRLQPSFLSSTLESLILFHVKRKKTVSLRWWERSDTLWNLLNDWRVALNGLVNTKVFTNGRYFPRRAENGRKNFQIGNLHKEYCDASLVAMPYWFQAIAVWLFQLLGMFWAGHHLNWWTMRMLKVIRFFSGLKLLTTARQ